MSEDVTTKTFEFRTAGLTNLKTELSDTISKLDEFTRLTYGVLGLLNRLGLPEDVEKSIRTIMRFIAAVNMLRASMLALETALVPGAGWLKASLALVSFVGSSMALAMELEAPRY